LNLRVVSAVSVLLLTSRRRRRDKHYFIATVSLIMRSAIIVFHTKTS
jgi:hypothetical protein